MKMRKMKKSAVSPSELGIRQPSSIKASTSYGTLVLFPTSVGDGRWGYFGEISVNDEDIAVYIYINSVDKDSLEQYDDEISYECDFTENYYNRETEREEEYDNGTVYLSIDLSDAYGRFEDMGWTVNEGIKSVASMKKSKKHYRDHIAYHTPGYDMEDEEEWHYFFGYCDSGNPDDIKVGGGESDMDAIDNSRDFADYYTYVSASYGFVSKQELIECIRKDGWWFVDGEETEGEGFPVDDIYKSKSTKKVGKMAKSSVRKNQYDRECVNYLEMPVCPDCGSPNLVEMAESDGRVDCMCSRCGCECNFTRDRFQDDMGARVRYSKEEWRDILLNKSAKKNKSTKKSRIGKSSNWQELYDEKHQEIMDNISIDDCEVEFHPYYASTFNLRLTHPDLDEPIDFEIDAAEYFGSDPYNVPNLTDEENIKYYAGDEFDDVLEEYADAVAEQYANENEVEDYTEDEDDDDMEKSRKTRARKGEGGMGAGSAGASNAVFTDNPDNDEDDAEKCGVKSIKSMITEKGKRK